MPDFLIDRLLIFSVGFFTIICFALFWLFFDALRLRFEIKTFLKSVGFILLGIGFGGALIQQSAQDIVPFLLWLKVLGFYLIFTAFAFDSHSKFQIGLIIGIIASFFFHDHAYLALMSFLITINIFQISYTTKHKDLTPFGAGFLLIFIAEFFRAVESTKTGSLSFASAFLYFFASLALLYWLWQYLVIRFNLDRKLLKI